MSTLSALALRASSLLREAGEDGVPVGRMREELGRSPGSVLAELRRHRFVVGEERGVLYLVHEPPADSAPFTLSPAMPERQLELALVRAA